jgi:hypothetical protein
VGWIRKSETYSPATPVPVADDDAAEEEATEEDEVDKVVAEEATEEDAADETATDDDAEEDAVVDDADDAEATCVAVGGTAVAVGGTVVAVGGTAVAVGGIAVALIASDDLDEAGTGGNGVGVGEEHATTNASTRPSARTRNSFVFIKGSPFFGNWLLEYIGRK